MSKMRKFIVPTKMSALPVASPSAPPMFSFEAMLQQKQQHKQQQQQQEQAADSPQPISTTVDDRTPATKTLGTTTKEPSTAARVPPLSCTDATPSPSSSTSTGQVNATPSPSSSTSTGQVKMCGYLKKKRNKMGGWRKLFFILQNQLLLSYSSREDYEKKLAPFKDIINLVPGTIIIPTTGPRFTIETNSKIMYTFRCDDHRSCSEWIMALLDSLTVANGATDRNRSFHRSTLPLASFASPSRCDPFPGVIGRANHEESQQQQQRTGPVKPPRNFPAASTTARPGRSQQQRQRPSTIATDDHNNNVSTKSSNVSASTSPSNTREDDDPGAGTMQENSASPSPSPPPEAGDDAEDTRQIFRLHQHVWSMSAHQSLDVCRINSMFSSAACIQPDRISEDDDGGGGGGGSSSSVTTSELHASSMVADHVYEDIRAPGALPSSVCPELEPIYAVVDVHAKRSRRLARLLYPDADAVSGTGSARKVSVSLPQISDGAELVTGQRRAATARSCSNYDDYEDVHFLADGDSVGTAGGSHELIAPAQSCYGQEHIYEPILVADDRLPSVTTGSSSSLPVRSEHSNTTSHNSLWRQLKRLHLDGSWRRLTLRTGDQHTATATQPQPTGTVLEGLGRRLDSHRRSIKKRIKNLRDRIDLTSLQPQQQQQPVAANEPPSNGAQSRKSISLDSFLRAKSDQNATASPLC